MLARLTLVGLGLVLGGVAHATTLRVSAEPPLSDQRLGDALRSYLDRNAVTVELTDGASPRSEPGLSVSLRCSHGLGNDVEVVLVDGEETVLVRLPGALRTEDLYRAAALKVQALLQRRAADGAVSHPVEEVSHRPIPVPAFSRDRLVLDAGLAWMQPSTGLARQGIRLGANLKLGHRLRLGIGAYLEPSQSTTVRGIGVSAWELPVALSLGFAWHQGSWQGWLEAVGHAATRRVSAEATDVVSSSEIAVVPRAGGSLVLAFALTPSLSVDVRLSLLAVLADTRYRVDGEVVWPSAATLLLLEAGLAYGAR